MAPLLFMGEYAAVRVLFGAAPGHVSTVRQFATPARSSFPCATPDTFPVGQCTLLRDADALARPAGALCRRSIFFLKGRGRVFLLRGHEKTPTVMGLARWLALWGAPLLFSELGNVLPSVSRRESACPRKRAGALCCGEVFLELFTFF